MSADATKGVAAGTRIVLLSMPDDPDPVPEGTRGTVLRANEDQLIVEWDNGRSLNVLIGIDRFAVVGERGEG